MTLMVVISYYLNRSQHAFEHQLLENKSEKGMFCGYIGCLWISQGHLLGHDRDRMPDEMGLLPLSLAVHWLNCCTATKTVLMTWDSIPDSWLKVDSAFYFSEVRSTQLAGGAMCSLHN